MCMIMRTYQVRVIQNFQALSTFLWKWTKVYNHPKRKQVVS